MTQHIGLPPLSPYETGAARETQWWTNRGIYLGYDIEAPDDPAHPLRSEWRLKAGQPHIRYRSDRHIVTVAPNGSGKTRRVLYPNLHQLTDWTICAIDPKGEMFAASAVHRSRGDNHRVVLVDPFEVVKKTYPHLAERHSNLCQSVGFNPVMALNPASDRFVDDAKALAVALIKTEDTKEKYFAQAAQALIKGLVMGLRLEAQAALAEVARLTEEYRKETGEEPPEMPLPKKARPSLRTMRAKLGMPPAKLADYCAYLIEQHGEAEPELAATLGEFTTFSAEDKEMGGIRRTAKVQTDWLGSKVMAADLERGAYDWASIKETPTTIYLVLPPEYLASHGTWLRLMVTSILRPLLRSVDDAGARPVPVLFMLDEFAQLGKMEIIEDNYALMRGFGVKLWTVFQDLNQAKSLYEERFESFISNAGMVQCFAPQDKTTRKYLSELADERLTWHEKKTDNEGFSVSQGGGGFNSGSSKSETHVKEPLMYPYELGQMGQGQAVIFTQRGLTMRSYFPDAAAMPGTADMMAEAADNLKPLPKLIA